MKRSSFILALIAASMAPGQNKKPQLKNAEIEVIAPVVRREDRLITVDAKLKNVGEKPALKLVVIYEVLDPDNKVLTRQRGGIDARDLEPGEDAEISSQMSYHARAVQLQLTFEDGSGRDLVGLNAGPYTIEQ
jgi:hypothetical protein